MDELRAGAVSLPADASSVAAARRHVQATLCAWGLGALVDTAALLVSELVTNALLHAGSELEVRVARDPEHVQVIVLDRSSRRPVRRRHGLGAGTGRGLGLVDVLADGWGTADGVDGWAKGVWFLLPSDADRLPRAEEGALYGEDWLALVADLPTATAGTRRRR